MKLSEYQGCEYGGGADVSGIDQSCRVNRTRKFGHHGINCLEVDVDPGQYPLTPSQCVVDGHEQDCMGVFEWWIQCRQWFVFSFSCQGEWLQNGKVGMI